LEATIGLQRRAIPQRVGDGVLMVLVLTRSTKQAARYIPGGGAERCSQCRFFYPQGTCGRIIGPVSPRGWCKYYSLEVVQRSQPGSTLNSSTPPSLDLDFSTGTLDPRITFTRASTATYFDVAGTLQTAVTNAPRFDYNPVTHAARGLLVEEARTNLVLNSATLVTQSVAVTAQAYTLSFYGTGTVTLSGASTAGPLVGAGAFPARTTPLTFTPTAGTLTLTVTGSVLNAQLEAGAFATTYIPTTAAAATRAIESATMPTAAWYNTNAFTYVLDGTMIGVNAFNQQLVSFSVGGSANDRTNIFLQPNGQPTLTTIVGGAAQVNAMGNGGLLAAGTFFRAGASVSTGLNAFSVNGAVASTVTSIGGLMPASNILRLAGLSATNSDLAVSRLRVWPIALSAAQLQAITQ
jgi:hypothetical protein